MNKRIFPVFLISALLLMVPSLLLSRGVLEESAVSNPKYGQSDAFRQLDEEFPTPNTYRTASGAPGTDYWQQRVNYVIDVELDDVNQRIIGSETVTYHNNSPDTLSYLWLQLDANIYTPDSDHVLTETAPSFNNVTFDNLRWMLSRKQFDGGVNITSVRDGRGKPLKHQVVKTMMRIDLAKPLKPRSKTTFSIDWNYTINERKYVSGRTGCEYFEEDGNYLYEIAQWFPRLCAYTDEVGWQNKQFLGRGEFTLEFGDYLVRITAPDDHVVGASGELQNPNKVLTPIQRMRLDKAANAEKPLFIVTPEEAEENEKSKPSGKKTWIFKADNVRDFAFVSSRKFIWDAQGHNVNGNQVMAMSYYPKEGEPLWSQYSTHAIIHTLNVYSKFSFDYPYPVAISVNGPVGGMEYPMICFNGPRPEKDGTYSKGTKYALISVIIHEVGHNFFPMIVNTDERQWTWMDEGFNTFLQYLSEQEWEEDYPSRRGEPKNIVNYMKSRNQVPIMTNSESILQFGNNAYAKPATALNILRETVLGRELFDFAFKEYSQRWMFKRPTPYDYFRTMEDASAVDLDWFWRGWFYTTHHTDISIENMTLYQMDSGDPDIDKPIRKKERDAEPVTLSEQRNKPLPKRIDAFPELNDFYNEFDNLDVTESDREKYQKLLEKLNNKEKEYLKLNYNFYTVDFKNIGGLVMPIILRIEYEDETKEELRIPAEIWRHNSQQVSKLIITDKTIQQLILDPHLETADTDTENNYFPRRIEQKHFKVSKPDDKENPMQQKKREEEEKKNKEKDSDGQNENGH